jgi:hypothetical protein
MAEAGDAPLPGLVLHQKPSDALFERFIHPHITKQEEPRSFPPETVASEEELLLICKEIQLLKHTLSGTPTEAARAVKSGINDSFKMLKMWETIMGQQHNGHHKTRTNCETVSLVRWCMCVGLCVCAYVWRMREGHKR